MEIFVECIRESIILLNFTNIYHEILDENRDYFTMR